MSEIKKVNKREVCVDVLRGLTICLMIIVDDPGGTPFKCLVHPIWDGITLADFVFPTFITLMGVSIYFSLSKYNFMANKSSIFRIIKRFILLCFFGWIITWICIVIRTAFSDTNSITTIFDFSNFRIMGIFQRIGLTYLFASFIVLLVKNKKVIIGIVVFILVAYCVCLGLGNGYMLSESNIISIIDKQIFTPNHMYLMPTYEGGKIPLDPEGLFSTIPCIAQALLGFIIGSVLANKKIDLNKKLVNIFVLGISLLVVGYILSFAIPAFKKAWTSTFVLIMVGTDACLLGLLKWITEKCQHTKWTKFFEIYGTNAVVSFACIDIIWLLFANLNLTSSTYNFLLPICFGVEGIASILTTLLFVVLLWLLLYCLYKKKIYIRF